VEAKVRVNPRFNPQADVGNLLAEHDAPMTTTDYLIDSALILLVLLQIRERPLTTRQLMRPVLVLGIAVASYLHGIPTGGNDLVLAGALALLGGAIGVASGNTVTALAVDLVATVRRRQRSRAVRIVLAACETA
jgi:hypothetical protein